MVRSLRSLYFLPLQLSSNVGRRELGQTAAVAARPVSAFDARRRRSTGGLWFFSLVFGPYSCERWVPRAFASRRTKISRSGAAALAHDRVDTQRRDALGKLGALPRHPTSAATVGRAIVRALRALYCLRSQLSLSVMWPGPNFAPVAEMRPGSLPRYFSLAPPCARAKIQLRCPTNTETASGRRR